MKPIKLEMQAFGPYKDKTIIDFDHFKNGLFLINGDTGSGKTTIFDAICYALYGSTSGDNKEKEDLKSGYAGIETLCYVELVFSYRDKIYTVRRVPSQIRAKKSGKGETEQNAEASLKYDDIDLSKTNEVDAKIKEIIGLDLKEFKQTMMIAQGDFRKLITCKTDERKAIFRDLLRTSELDQFKRTLKSILDEKCNALKNKEAVINEKVSGFETENKTIKGMIEGKTAFDRLDEFIVHAEVEIESNNSAFKEAKFQYEKAAKAYESMIRNHAELINKKNDFDEYNRLLVTKKNLEDQKEEFEEDNKKIGKSEQANNAMKMFADFEDSSKSLKRNVESIAADEGALNEENTKKNGLEKIFSESNEKFTENNVKISSIIEKLKKNKDCIKQISNKREEIKNKNICFKNAKEELSQAKAKAQNIEKELSKISEFLEKSDSLAELLSKKANLDQKLLAFNAYVSQIKIFKTHSDNLEKEKQELDSLLGKLKSAEKQKDTAYQNYMHNQIGLVIDLLEEGKPCPVCGSIHHPNIAKKDENTITKEEFEKISGEYESINGEYLNKSASFNSKQKSIIEQGDSLINQGKENFDFKFVLKSFDGDSIAYSDALNKSIKELQDKIDAIKNADNKQKSLESEQKNISNDLNNIKDKISGYESDIKVLESELNNLLKENIDKSKEEIDLLIKRNENELKALKAKKENDETNLKASEALISTLKGRLDANYKLKDELIKKTDRLKNIYLEYLKECDFDSIESAKLYVLDDLTTKNLKAFIEKYKSDSSYCEKRLDDLSKKDFSDCENIDTSKFEQIEKDSKAELDSLLEEKNCYEKKFQDNSEILKQIKKETSLIQTQINEKNEIAKLYNVASGQVPGNAKIDFETYYQARIFDNILALANDHLNRMSGNKFVLKRKEDVTGFNKVSGLDINIIDNFNGKERSGNSLSGGESFLASLALALALSEIIQYKAGGIELDSMFIDEGFGTLDKAYLKDCMDGLHAISADKKRMVGLISHVDFLSESIEKQIVVTKGPDGSKIKIY